MKKEITLKEILEMKFINKETGFVGVIHEPIIRNWHSKHRIRVGNPDDWEILTPPKYHKRFPSTKLGE